MSNKRLLEAIAAGVLTFATALVTANVLASRKTVRADVIEQRQEIPVWDRPIDSIVTEIKVGINQEIQTLEELDDWLEANDWIELEITFFPTRLFPHSMYQQWVDPLRLIALRAKVWYAV